MVQIILASRGRITTHFHQDIGRGFLHRGIDQGHGNGTKAELEIRATADGLIRFAGPFGSYGLCYFITHDDGWTTVLAHHKSHLLTEGDRVKQGQLIAVMGNSGTKYVHSHQELRDAAGNQVDPLAHIGAFASLETKEIDMALDAADKKWLDGMGQSIIDQVGNKAWLNGLGEAIVSQLAAQIGPRTWAEPITHSGVTGPASLWLGNMSDAVGRLKLSGDGADYAAFAAELHKTLPAEVVAAIKAAL